LGLRQTLLMRFALPAAIVLAGALIAASIAITNRWAISNAAPQPGAYRSDRWTGQTMWCGHTETEAPSPLDCPVIGLGTGAKMKKTTGIVGAILLLSLMLAACSSDRIVGQLNTEDSNAGRGLGSALGMYGSICANRLGMERQSFRQTTVLLTWG
jgi:hypothetical protein